MKALVNGLESACVHMGIDLGGGNVGMAEHHLHRAEICPACQQVGGKGMPHSVRADFFVDSPVDGQLPDDLPEPVSGHGPAPVTDKEIWTGTVLEQGRSAALQVILDFFSGCIIKGYHPLFVSFA